MTKHNLQQHLQWYLKSGLFTPPPDDPTIPRTRNLGLDASSAESQSSNSEIQEATSVVSGFQVPETRNVTATEDKFEFRLPEIPNRNVRQKDSQQTSSQSRIEMARLQSSGRSSMKARLLSRQSPDPLQIHTPQTHGVGETSGRGNPRQPGTNVAYGALFLIAL